MSPGRRGAGGRPEDEAEQEPVAAEAQPRKGRRRVTKVLLLGSAVVLVTRKGVRNRVLDAVFGPEEEFEYESPTEPAEFGIAPTDTTPGPSSQTGEPAGSVEGERADAEPPPTGPGTEPPVDSAAGPEEPAAHTDAAGLGASAAAAEATQSAPAVPADEQASASGAEQPSAAADEQPTWPDYEQPSAAAYQQQPPPVPPYQHSAASAFTPPPDDEPPVTTSAPDGEASGTGAQAAGTEAAPTRTHWWQLHRSSHTGGSAPPPLD